MASPEVPEQTGGFYGENHPSLDYGGWPQPEIVPNWLISEKPPVMTFGEISQNDFEPGVCVIY